MGGGSQLYLIPLAPADGGGGGVADPGLHVTGGVEFRVAPAADVYAELQPGTDFGLEVFMANVRVGVNAFF